MSIPKRLAEKRDALTYKFFGDCYINAVKVDQSTCYQEGFNAATRLILSSDAVVSMHDALLGHMPTQDAIQKWKEFVAEEENDE